jgi:hypothetical protein
MPASISFWGVSGYILAKMALVMISMCSFFIVFDFVLIYFLIREFALFFIICSVRVPFNFFEISAHLLPYFLIDSKISRS